MQLRSSRSLLLFGLVAVGCGVSEPLDTGNSALVSQLRPELWFEDNNLGDASLLPPDFTDRFWPRNRQAWAEARAHMKVHFFRASWLTRTVGSTRLISDADITRISNVLSGDGIALGLDVGGATLSDGPARQKIITEEHEAIERLITLTGPGKIRYLSLQSALSKRQDDTDPNARVDDVVSYIEATDARFKRGSSHETFEYGLVDALPNWLPLEVYEQRIRALRTALEAKGKRLAFYALDTSWSLVDNGGGSGGDCFADADSICWAKVKAVENFIRRGGAGKGTRFVLLAKSRRGGTASSAAFHEQTLNVLRDYPAAGGSPDAYWVGAHYEHPRWSIPDSCRPCAMSSDAPNEYTSLATLRSFAERLNALP